MRFIILICSLAILSPSSAEVISIGERVNLKASPSGAIHVSSRRPIQVLDRGRNLEVWGKRIGSAMISQGAKVWWIHVLEPNVAATYRAFSSALESMMGLDLNIEDSKVVVRGRLLRLSDWTRLAGLQRTSGGTWQMRAKIDPSISSESVKHLRGIAAKTQESIAAYGLDISSPTANSGGIRLELTIAEVLHSAADRLGLSYDDGQSVQILPTLTGPSSIEAKLGFLAQNGEAKILAKPTLVARLGSEAEFLAGGEFAIRTSSYRAKDVTWKRHGLWLRFLPELRTDDVVAIKVATEFSHPDFSQMVDGIPSLKTHKTNTNVDVEMGKTLLLSGLVQSHFGRAGSGVAGLKDIPMLGLLFGSQDYTQSRSELMVFLKPQLVEPD